MRAAMVGGAGYAVGKRRAQSQEHEAQQDAEIQQSQAGQASPEGGGGAMSEVERLDALKKLGDLPDGWPLHPSPRNHRGTARRPLRPLVRSSSAHIPGINGKRSGNGQPISVNWPPRRASNCASNSRVRTEL